MSEVVGLKDNPKRPFPRWSSVPSPFDVQIIKEGPEVLLLQAMA